MRQLFHLAVCTILLASAAIGDTCTNLTSRIVGTGGIDIGKMDNVGACCDACLKDITCTAFTFDGAASSTAAASCWLKTNTDDSGVCSRGACTSGLSGRGPSFNSACLTADSAKYQFCNQTLSIDDRLADLVSRIKPEEMASQLTARESSALTRLGIPAYYWGTNALHSIREASCIKAHGTILCPTAFPTPPNYGASFNMTLVQEMGNSFATELRAFYNHRALHSLDTWSPTINIARDPRWGRNVEVPSEDPYLTGQYALAYTLGAQNGPEPEEPMVGVTLKHWLGYSVEGGVGPYSRHTLDANISAYDLASSYMPGFEVAIRSGNALGVMCSYNMLNGKPTCGDPDLTATLREDWGFEGYITSDTDACGDIFKTHHFAEDGEHATAVCLAGGTDINSGNTYNKYLASGIADGTIPLALPRAALHNAYKFRMRLGLFDADSSSANRRIPVSVIGSAAHKASALNAARQSMVLLQNDDKRGLPFPPGQRLAVIGSDVDNIVATMGNYNANNICPTSLADASVVAADGAAAAIDTSCLRSYWDVLNATNAAAGGTSVLLAKASWTDADIAAAVALVGKVDQVLLVVSNAEDEGSEGTDRASIALKADQAAMAAAVLAAANQKPRVRAALLMVNGGVIGLDGLRDAAPAILETFMPGVYGAEAVAETVWGHNVPGGKLPVTMYYSNYTDGCDLDDMGMQACGGRSYRYYDGPVLFPFGHGISYTTFSLQWSSNSPPTAVLRSQADSATYAVVVTNTGSRYAADEVVLAFFRPKAASIRTLAGAATPVVLKQLFAFERVHLAPGQEARLSFTVNATALGLVDELGHTSLHPGQYDIVFSRGCVACDELVAPVVVADAAFARLKTFRRS